MQNKFNLCNLIIIGEKHRERMYPGEKTGKDILELTTVGNSMMADLVLLVNSQKLVMQSP